MGLGSVFSSWVYRRCNWMSSQAIWHEQHAQHAKHPTSVTESYNPAGRLATGGCIMDLSYACCRIETFTDARFAFNLAS